ncbi:TDP-N-acetylfucosamine:lipid II N-acetylfucosaminyltransferase [Cryobacterium sp. PH31-AA6]|uniref:TDP-N-acetylfucosamine:lipid II N-acetylfucosaminyltransferase n=1 Tax=Cryobacterium sp. PH31-AA6 TaxID=3046205 RepID=UPI0024BAC860|nr:TDP-N-acetylfucosamine:lipid II N-acetylfucosaminyltransferase [Cryobacterium sp. PH31-AA6]MDJ0323889.1 TDP-N-acetylfucosamine:lipid II N-acetylfucosaminyltransferase [Cryobacterium sp. PH31-AA6]
MDFFATLDGVDTNHVVLQTIGSNRWTKTKGVTLASCSNQISWFFTYCRLASRADRIFVHGLAGGRLTVSLALAPWALSKCYWLIWGADLYAYRHRKRSIGSRIIEPLRRFVIKRFGHLVTYLKGDVDLAREWYGARGTAHDCLLYTGNTVQIDDIQTEKPLAGTRIQVGNSADPENFHLEVFEALATAETSVQVYSPLSYGNAAYREAVITAGQKSFGSRFVPMVNLLPSDEYQTYLRSIDVAIFNHRRQQGMGNTISLLSMGKRVYLRRSTAQWDLFQSLGVVVSAFEDGIDVSPLPAEVRASNVRLMSEVFSRERLVQQWVRMIEEPNCDRGV